MEGTHIYFRLATQQNPKTSIWDVVAKDGDIVLGQVRWFGRWRGYAFFPGTQMVFERVCLREIADFIEQNNKSQRAQSKEASRG